MSPIAQMERLHHPIHVGFGRHLEGARAFHFKSLSISVIGGFNSLFQGLILFILSEVSGEAPGWDLGLLGC